MAHLPNLAWLTRRPIAHRGLHDMNREVWENTATAFERAATHDYAIECDVHLSRDRVPVVVHDPILKRLAGLDLRVGDLDAADLERIAIGETKDTIPTLERMLASVAARVPIVVELKGSDPADDTDMASRVADVLDGYKGRVALMSFDAWLLESLAFVADRFPIGLTAEGTTPEKLERHSAVYDSHCAFVSYNVHHLPNTFVDRVREAAPVISWTVRDDAARTRSLTHADQMTFEGFHP